MAERIHKDFEAEYGNRRWPSGRRLRDPLLDRDPNLLDRLRWWRPSWDPQQLGLWSAEIDRNFRSYFFINIQHLFKESSRTPVTERSLYFALLRQWLQECDEGHECRSEAEFWPTRIIFVGNSDSTKLELWETTSKNGELFDVDGYVALSHSWGGPTEEEKKRFCTTQQNYQRRLEGFRLDELPKTFEDAVHVTRALGKQYLWIDALCIIQPIEGTDDSDWKIEAGCMEQVFGSAYCTIAASSAENWKEGFLESKSATRFLRYAGRWKPARLVKEAVRRWVNRVDYTKDVDAARLNQRAWVLQERVSSRRIVHFTENHTYWECGDAMRCENFTELKCPPGREQFLIDPEFPKRLQDSSYFRMVDFIQFLFEKYAQSGITKKSDRVVAISSLVKRIEGAFGTKCRYGVFDTLLSRLLMWRRRDNTDSNETHYKVENLPSWSWMTYSRIQFLPIDHQLQVPTESDLRLDTEQEKVLLVQVRTFQSCTIVQKERRYTIIDEDSVNVGFLSFDMPTHVDFKHLVVIGMELTLGKVVHAEKNYHILLVRKAGLENRYQRVGLGEIKARCVSEDCAKGELC